MRKPNGSFGNLAQRCREIIEWKNSGLLARDGELRAFAAQLTHLPDHYRLQVAEELTKTEAMEQIAAGHTE